MRAALQEPNQIPSLSFIQCSKDLLRHPQPIQKRMQLINRLLRRQLNNEMPKPTANSRGRQPRARVHILAPDLLDVEARLPHEIVVAVLDVGGDLDLAASFLVFDHRRVVDGVAVFVVEDRGVGDGELVEERVVLGGMLVCYRWMRNWLKSTHSLERVVCPE